MAASHEVEITELAGLIRPGEPQAALTERIAQSTAPGEIRAGLAHLNGDWDLAHRISQALDSAEGAHWHALVHRHEPDFPNSKYWLRRAGDSAIYPALREAAQAAGQVVQVAPGGVWDPYLFTDCFADPAMRDWTRPLDALEAELLLRQERARFGL